MAERDHLSLRDAVRFLWHSTVHRSHAESVWYDVRAQVVRCKTCGRKWGDR